MPLTAFMINTIYAMSFISLGSGVTENGLTCEFNLLHTGLGPSTTPNTGYPDWLAASKAKCLKCLSNICQGTKFSQIDLLT